MKKSLQKKNSSTLLTCRFDVKPMSANKMYYRAKQLTAAYRNFREDMYESYVAQGSPPFPFEKGVPLKFKAEVGFSSKLSDLDNACKPLIDTLQYLLGFNDRTIFALDFTKVICRKNEEYINVEITQYEG